MTSANVAQIPMTPVQIQLKGQAKAGNEGKDFMQIMSASISKNSASDIRDSVGVAAPVKGEAVSQQTEAPVNAEKVQPVNRPEVKTVDTKQTTDNKAEGLTTEEIEEISEVIATSAVEITEVIAEDLSVPVEEVIEAFDELEIMPIEIADPKVLSDVVCEVTGMDKMELLTDPKLSEVKEDLKPIIDEMVKELPVETPEEIPGFAKDFAEMTEVATGVDLGPDGEVVPVSEPKDGVQIASDEVIITDFEEDNLIVEDTADDEVAVVTPEAPKTQAPVSRQYIAADDDMDDEQLHAVEEYNDSQDEMVETARTMGSAKSDQGETGRDQGRDASFNRHETGFEHVAHNVSEGSTPQVQNTTFAETVTEATARYTSIDTRELIEQIVTQVRTTVTESVTTMSLELHPASLGKMYVQVSEQDGTINAKLFTESENVKQALESSMTALKEQGEQQGSKVNAIEISVGTREFEEQMESQAEWNQNENRGSGNAGEAGEGTSSDNRSGNRSINLGDAEDGVPEDLTEAEALEASMMQDYGNTLSMRA